MSEEYGFRLNAIQNLLEEALTEANGGEAVKISPSLSKMVSEYLRCVCVEATNRARAVVGDSGVIEEYHLEKILPQLLLDIA